MNRSYNSILIGLLIGILGPLTILFGVQVFEFPHMSFWTFIRVGFATGTLSPWLKLATLFNLAPFFIFVNSNRLQTGRGIVFATILSGLVIVYFTLM
ncbi:MAG: hypothetical protein ACJAR8_001352 [Bacteroidia bacterium]|jgi:hypothetical protein|nr:hypothetical protein [Bacteroidia bacterium]